MTHKHFTGTSSTGKKVCDSDKIVVIYLFNNEYWKLIEQK